MKIADLQKSQLPILIKINDGFKLENTVDVGFIIEVLNIELYNTSDDEYCYRVFFRIPNNYVPVCKAVAKKTDGYYDSLSVMKNDDWFEFFSSNETFKEYLNSFESKSMNYLNWLEKSLSLQRQAMKKLESLTPGGSEFYNDPSRCHEHIKSIIEYQHKMILKNLK